MMQMENNIWKKNIGHFKYYGMLFELINVPTIFEYAMSDVYCELLDKFVVWYFDDFLIHSKNIEKYKEHVKFVLQKLWDAGLYTKLEKSVFHQLQVQFFKCII